MTGVVSKNGETEVISTDITFTPSTITSPMMENENGEMAATNFTPTSSQVASWNNSVGGSYSYTYDDRGNILTISDGTNTTRYTYDALDQLTREDNQLKGSTWTYSYDSGGNITSKKEYAYTTGTLGTATSTKSYTYGNSSWRDLLTSYNGQTLTYDTIGNLLTDGTWTYTWEHGRQLAGMSKSGTTISYAYNADGLRTSKTVDGVTTQYHYVGDTLAGMTKGDDELYFVYDVLGPSAVIYNGTTYYYTRNAQGDITGIVGLNSNNQYEQVVSYTYDAWGNPLTTTGALANTLGELNPLRYRGYVYDSETGLYYLQSRYYSPAWGRFINADGQLNDDLLGNNQFAYCGNNPAFRKDDGGNLWKVALIAAAIGGIVGAVSKIATNMITPGAKWHSGIIGAFAGGAMYGAATVVAPLCPEFAAYAGAFAESLTNEVASYNAGLSKVNGEETTRKVTWENTFNSATNVACDTIAYGSLLAFTGGMASAVMPFKAPVGNVSLGVLVDYGAKCFGQTAFQSSLMMGGSIFSNVTSGVYDSEQKEAVPVMP